MHYFSVDGQYVKHCHTLRGGRLYYVGLTISKALSLPFAP
jgi:hypothetical protein